MLTLSNRKLYTFVRRVYIKLVGSSNVEMNLKIVNVYKDLDIMFSEHLSYEDNTVTLSQALGSIIDKYKFSTYAKLVASSLF